MRAILFPGQGSQYVGMGSDFYNRFDLVKKTFNTVDETLGFSLSKFILNGPENKLQLTQNTQPAIMTVGVTIFNVLRQEFGFNLNNASFFAGHSLGEYTALVCGGSLTIERAAYLLNERGKSMQDAVPPGHGAMIAVLGMSINEVLEEIKRERGQISNDGDRWIDKYSGYYICDIAYDTDEGYDAGGYKMVSRFIAEVSAVDKLIKIKDKEFNYKTKNAKIIQKILDRLK